MIRLQQAVSEWAEATFGPVGSNISVATRANKEMSELLQALTSDDNHPDAKEEVADVVMVLCRLAQRMGFDLEAEVWKKLALNKKRKWKLDGHGHGYHIRERRRSPKCKLSPEQIAEILSRRAAGEKYEVLMVEFGISKSLLQYYINGNGKRRAAKEPA